MVCSSSEVYILRYYFALQILAGYTNMTSVMAPSLPPLFINFVSTSLLALLPHFSPSRSIKYVSMMKR